LGELVVVETDQAIATIRLNRPPMNALSAALQADLGASAA
jgi:enoyl-CoA hydratase/carnithine racemase